MDTRTQSLIVGFLLTTVLGGLLGAWIQRSQWNRQARLEIAKQGYSDATDLLDRVLTLIDRRYYHLYRWFLSVRDDDPQAKIDERERIYYEQVHAWNESLRTCHQSIRRHLGVSYALSYLNYRDDLTPERPSSLHYRFVLCTNMVQALKTDRSAASEPWAEIEKLNWHLTEFAQEATSALMQRSQSLSLLRASDWSKGHSPSLTSRPEPVPPSGLEQDDN